MKDKERKKILDELARFQKEVEILNKIKKANEKLQILQESILAIHSSLDLKKVFKKITDITVYSMGYITCLLLTVDDEEKYFKIKAFSTKRPFLSRINKILGFPLKNLLVPRDPDLNPGIRLVLEGKLGIFKKLAEIAYPIISKNKCLALQNLGRAKNYIAVPLKIKDEVIGAMFITSSQEEVSEEEKRIIQIFARATSQAIMNAKLHLEIDKMKKELQHTLNKLRDGLEKIVQVITLMVEGKDPYTAGHQRRVADLARAIAKEMGLSNEQIEIIRIAGTIHDIGKINIPTEILSKPGRLNKSEFDIIKSHPRVGYKIIKKVDFPWPVADIILQHHERMDGSGYPQGLKGKDILLEARILAVADVVEAMSSHRPYREAMGIDKALEEIEKSKGKLYDPETVDACLRLFREKGFKFK